MLKEISNEVFKKVAEETWKIFFRKIIYERNPIETTRLFPTEIVEGICEGNV